MTCLTDTCLRWSRTGILGLIMTLLLVAAPTLVGAQPGPFADPTTATDDGVVALDAAADPSSSRKEARDAEALDAKVAPPALDDKPGPSSAELINAGTSLPDETAITSGTYKPTNYVTGDTFSAPAPTPSGNVPFAIFNGTNPTGT